MITSSPPRRRVRSLVKRILVHFLWFTGLLSLAKWWIRRHGAVVLSFHRILSREESLETTIQDGMILRDETFAALLRYLRKNHSVIDLANACHQTQRDRVQIALTFDDGWEDNASTALPIALESKVPLTIFICPGLMGRSLPFWPEHVSAIIRSAECAPDGILKVCRVLTRACHADWAAELEQERVDRAGRLIEHLKTVPAVEREKVLELIFKCEIPIELFVNHKLDRTMSWSQVGHLDKSGVTFGSHTQRHEILPRIPLARVEQEIAESKATIREYLAKDCFLFSYPNGDASPEVRDVVSRSGFKLAFINSPGVWRHNGDPFLIPRINIWENRVTGSDGQFSPLAFEYSVFWRAFIHWRRSRSTTNASTVTGDGAGSVLRPGSVPTLQTDSASLSSVVSNERADRIGE